MPWSDWDWFCIASAGIADDMTEVLKTYEEAGLEAREATEILVKAVEAG